MGFPLEYFEDEGRKVDLLILLDRLRQGLVSRTLRWFYRHSLCIGGPLRIGRGVVIRNRSHGDGESRRLRIVTAGHNTIGSGVIIQGNGRLFLGEKSYFAEYCVIGCNSEVSIGRNAMIAPAVTIRDTDHAFARTDVPMNQQGITTAPVHIGDDVWIGHGAAILKGVTIGNGAIIAAGAVVNCDVESFHIVGGVPARVIGNRLSTVGNA